MKLAYQESELVGLLKKIPLGTHELAVVRERAEKLRDGTLKSRGDALLPLMLASFIFDSLCLPGQFPSTLMLYIVRCLHSKFELAPLGFSLARAADQQSGAEDDGEREADERRASRFRGVRCSSRHESERV